MDIVHHCHLIVFVLNNKNSGIVVICHEDMTGKRGENAGIRVFPISVEFQYFGRKTLHYSIMMMSLHYIANDIISLSPDYK